MICLPELFRSQYFCQTEDHANFDLAEPIPGPTTEALARVAKEAGVVVIGSLFERRAAGLYHNTAVVIDADGSTLGLYRKMHIPDDPLYYEKFYFTPGDLGFRAFDTAFGRIGTLVCWDQWYPEGARLTALAGADVLFYPDGHRLAPGREGRVRRGAGGRLADDAARARHRQRRLRRGGQPRRAREAQVGAAARASSSGAAAFVADPFGVVLAEASRTEEEILIVPCDRRHQETVRRHWPFLRDRRIDAYGAITRRFIDE